MRVLITNNTLDMRAGSELYVRDVATALLARGHTPIAFSTRLGLTASDLRAATVPVVSSLDQLGEPPDIIHGQHHLETMTALLRFPAVPAIFFCHGWLPWEETPPLFPRILRYVAVDDTCRDRLVAESGVPGDRVEVILNFVDLDRFRRRGPLPPRPRRALVLSNQAHEATQVPAIREACRRQGIELEVAGAACGRPVERSEDLLPGFDLVFAKGRTALEAMAVGACVIVCDAHGLGARVSAGDVARMRRLNFGVRLLDRPLRVEAIEREIEDYDSADAARVCSVIRGEAGLRPVVDRIVALYEAVLRDYREGDRPTVPTEASAAARYLEWLNPWFKEAVAAREACVAMRSESELRLRVAEAAACAAEANIERVQATLTWRTRGALLRVTPLRLYQRLRGCR